MCRFGRHALQATVHVICEAILEEVLVSHFSSANKEAEEGWKRPKLIKLGNGNLGMSSGCFTPATSNVDSVCAFDCPSTVNDPGPQVVQALFSVCGAPLLVRQSLCPQWTLTICEKVSVRCWRRVQHEHGRAWWLSLEWFKISGAASLK